MLDVTRSISIYPKVLICEISYPILKKSCKLNNIGMVFIGFYSQYIFILTMLIQVFCKNFNSKTFEFKQMFTPLINLISRRKFSFIAVNE